MHAALTALSAMHGRIGEPLAILAGGGRFPALVAEAAESAGRRVVLIGIRGEAELAGSRRPDAWVKRGQIGRLLRLTAAAGARDLVLIGAIRDRRLPRLSEVDLVGLWTVLRHRRLLEGGDDGVLRRLAAVLEGAGLRVVGAGEIAPGLLAGRGAIGALLPDPAESADIVLGLQAARALGRRDAGQGVAVAQGAIVAREGADGTDAMLARLAAERRGRGGVLVKCPKPQQDRRLDLPAIGPETVRQAAAAGLRGIAVEAGGVLVADRADVAALADAAGMFVVGVPGPPPSAPVAGP